MKIAILLHGQPRYLEEGAWWFQNRVFPQHLNQLEVDYYCCFWHDGSPNLEQRVKEAYNPVQVSLHDYDTHINNFIDQIHQANENCSVKDLLPKSIRENVLCDSEKQYLSQYCLNFWGQFLSCDLMTKMTGDLSNKYQIVCRTRSDVVFNSMTQENWMSLFRNLYRNNVFDNKILSDWMYVKNGHAYVGDFAFWTKPSTWYNYTKNMRKNCLDIATVHKLMWYNCHLGEEMPFPHHTWMHLSQFSKTDWLSFSVVWPTPYGSALIRHPVQIKQESYESLKKQFDHHEQTHK